MKKKMVSNLKDSELTEDQFEELYKPVQNHITKREEWNGWLFETYGEDEQYIKELARTEPGRVWTIIDEDGLHIVSGWHFVNRFGYIVTEIPVKDGEFFTVPDED